MSLLKPFIAHIDSDYRQSGSHSDFTYKIKLPRAFDMVAVVNASIPRSFYLVRDNYNTFTLEEDGKTATVTMSAGNYSLRNFATNLTTNLNTASPNGYTYSADIPSVIEPQTGKITFSVSGNGGVQPKFIFSSTEGINRQLGFEAGTTNTFSGDELISTNVVQMVVNTIYLKSNIIIPEYNTLSDSILISIPNQNTPDFSSIPYTSTDIALTSKLLSTHQDDSFRFIFTDADDVPLDFNGVPCNFTLAFWRYNDVDQMRKKQMLIGWYEDVVKNTFNQ